MQSISADIIDKLHPNPPLSLIRHRKNKADQNGLRRDKISYLIDRNLYIYIYNFNILCFIFATGFLAIPGAALGQVTGGYLCKRFNLKLVGILKLVLISSSLVVCLTPVFWAKCADVSLAGVLVNYPQ